MSSRRSWRPLVTRLPGADASLASETSLHGPDVREVGDLRLDVTAMRAYLSGNELSLTAQEFDLLLLLAMAEGRTVSSHHLSQAIWQKQGPHHVRHLSVLVARLRAKVAASRTHRLETRRKRGYGLLPVAPFERGQP